MSHWCAEHFAKVEGVNVNLWFGQELRTCNNGFETNKWSSFLRVIAHYNKVVVGLTGCHRLVGFDSSGDSHAFTRVDDTISRSQRCNEVGLGCNEFNWWLVSELLVNITGRVVAWSPVVGDVGRCYSERVGSVMVKDTAVESRTILEETHCQGVVTVIENFDITVWWKSDVEWYGCIFLVINKTQYVGEFDNKFSVLFSILNLRVGSHCQLITIGWNVGNTFKTIRTFRQRAAVGRFSNAKCQATIACDVEVLIVFAIEGEFKSDGNLTREVGVVVKRRCDVNTA